MFGFKTISKRKYNDLIDQISSQRAEIYKQNIKIELQEENINSLKKLKTVLETKVNKLQRNRDKKGRFIK